MNLLIQDLGIVEVELFGNETIRRRFEESASDNSHSQVNSRTHGQDYDQYDVFPHFLFPVLIHKLFPLEMHQPHTDKRSQTDKYGIDEIEVERAQKIDQIARSQSVTGRTERRHQRSGNGNSRNHISFLLGREGNHSGKSAEKCDENVINGR